MLKKQDILNSTDGGLEVFRYYLQGDWRVGKNFKNPLYDDKNASCNIYKDKRSDTYKMKDFGNESFSGDCFFLVGYLHGLDCRNSSDFVDILKIINRDLGLCLRFYRYAWNGSECSKTSCCRASLGYSVAT
ncbi:hypothetical protein ACIRNY_02915 [Capnocytophaga canimorsus]|uniref:hypothetical protein n=1 Tax=Capnocytophaga canimorsus TaxID=28188 RepID=UPI00384CE8F8